MMKIVLMAFALFLFAACDNAAAPQKPGLDGAANALTIVTKDGKSHAFRIELALTPREQAKGLMNRTEMADTSGMLFLFSGDEERSFWMKNTLLPLDIIFIRKDGVIHRIHENAVPQDLTSIPSNGPVRAVLEINGGLAQKLGLQDGDTVRHLFFGNAQSK